MPAASQDDSPARTTVAGPARGRDRAAERPARASADPARTDQAPGDLAELLDEIAAARELIAATQARIDELCLRFVDARTAELDEELPPKRSRPRGARNPAMFAAAELAPALGKSSFEVAHSLARARRIRSLPAVAEAAAAGALDADRVKRIDTAARMIVRAETLEQLDQQVVAAAAETHTVGKLGSWLDRFVARLEPDQLQERHRRAHEERRVSVFQAVNAIGYVTGEVSAVDAEAIDGRLSRLAWELGADDPRTLHQRRSDLFADLLLGRAVGSEPAVLSPVLARAGKPPSEVLEIERIDPETGEYLGTELRSVDSTGEPIASTAGPPTTLPPMFAPTTPLPSMLPSGSTISRVARGSGSKIALDRLPHHGPQVTVGVVVTMEALAGWSDTPAELGSRGGTVPASLVRGLARRPDTLFARLLTDPGGRLLDVTELGRFPSDKLGFAVRARSGACVFPTCTRPASLCDLDHHRPAPAGPTAAGNLGPLCRAHHNAKTFGHLEVRRVAEATLWTDATSHHYRCQDDPLPVERSGPEPVPLE